MISILFNKRFVSCNNVNIQTLFNTLAVISGKVLLCELVGLLCWYIVHCKNTRPVLFLWRVTPGVFDWLRPHSISSKIPVKKEPERWKFPYWACVLGDSLAGYSVPCGREISVFEALQKIYGNVVVVLVPILGIFKVASLVL